MNTAIILSIFACTGDSSDSGPVHHDDDPAMEACEETSNAGTALTGAATAEDAGTAVVEMDGGPYTVTLQDGAPTYVDLHGPGDVDALLFAGTANVVSALSHAKVPTELPAAGSAIEHCPDAIPEHYDLHLHETAYVLELSAAAVDTVWLHLTDAEGHEDGHHPDGEGHE